MELLDIYDYKTTRDKVYSIIESYKILKLKLSNRTPYFTNELKLVFVSSSGTSDPTASYGDAQVSLVSDLNELIEKLDKAPETRKESDRIMRIKKERQEDLRKINARADSLYIDYKNELITLEQYKRLKEDTEKQLNQLKSSLENLQHEELMLKDGIQPGNSYLQMFMKYKTVGELSRSLLVDLVDTIYINADGSITIDFNFSDKIALIADYIASNELILSKKIK